MKKIHFAILALLLFMTTGNGLDIPKSDEFSIKNIKDKNILYVVHKKEKGHITNTLIKLIQFYLLEESDDYKVVFPQVSIEKHNIDGEYFAVGFTGNPKVTKDVKITKLKGGIFASYIYKGSYKTIGKAIRDTFQKILKTKKYIPNSKSESRLVYWNSIDDNHPKDLITEIQIRVTKIR